MIDSADVRKLNKNKIRKIMWKGGVWTKQTVADVTGLSVATCNTLLNELEKEGEIIGQKQRLNEVGRCTSVFQINEDFESILCISFEMILGVKTLHCTVLSMCNRVLATTETIHQQLDISSISQEISAIFSTYPNISSVVIGTPSIAEHGVIRHCDIAELDNEPLVQIIEKQYHVPVYMENDMYFKAYGYYKTQCTMDDVVTILNYPSHILPGTATIHRGTIVTGKNGFAGMVGFLPFDIGRDRQIELLSEQTCVPLISKAAASLIAIMNPNRMIFTGDLLTPSVMKTVMENCKQYIPNEYMPSFQFVEDIQPFYLEGMYRQAIDKKAAIINNKRQENLL